MKIAIFHLAFIYSGGGEKLVLEEARGLEKKGHQVTILTPVLDKKRCFPDIIDQFNIKTLVPKLPSFIPQWEAFQILLACVLVPLFAHQFKEFDVILAANQPSPWLAWIIKKMYGVPYVAYLAQPTRFLHPRNIDREVGLVFTKRSTFSPATLLMELAKPLVNWADRTSIKEANMVLSNGGHAKEILERTYGIKAVSCPAGAYPVVKLPSYKDRSGGALKVAGKPISKPFMLITNRHFPQKRFEYAISSLTLVAKKMPSISLVITGQETDYTESLKNLVKQLSLEDKAIFLGLVSEKDLKKLYASAAVYVYTAPEEDFGMGMVEAMAHGTPVVAWNNAGPTGIVVDGKTGFLAKPFDVVDFADKVAKLLGDKKLAEKMGRAGWERVKKKFLYEKHRKILENALLDSLKS